MLESEIVIIGGGIAGVSTAYHLAQYGHDVTLIERGSIAGEASGLNAGNIGATGWGNLPNLNSHLPMGSLEIFKTLQLDLVYDIEFRQCGALPYKANCCSSGMTSAANRRMLRSASV